MAVRACVTHLVGQARAIRLPAMYYERFALARLFVCAVCNSRNAFAELPLDLLVDHVKIKTGSGEYRN